MKKVFLLIILAIIVCMSSLAQTCMKPIRSSVNMYEFYCDGLSLSPDGYVWSGTIVKETNLPIGPLKNIPFAANSFVEFYESGYVGRGKIAHDIYVSPYCSNSGFVKLKGGYSYCFANTKEGGCGVVYGTVGESCIINGVRYNAGDGLSLNNCKGGMVITPCDVQ